MTITRKLICLSALSRESSLMPTLVDRLERRQSMKIVPLPRPEHAHHVCNMCGKPSEITICDECSERLRIEALAKKKHEEQGSAWCHWE